MERFPLTTLELKKKIESFVTLYYNYARSYAEQSQIDSITN